MAKVAKVWTITLFDVCTAMYWSREAAGWCFRWVPEAAKVVKVQTECLPVDPIHHLSSGMTGAIGAASRAFGAGSKCKRAWSRWRVAPLDGLLLRLLCTLRALLSWLGSVFVAEDHFGGGRKKLRKSRDFGPIWNGFVKLTKRSTTLHESVPLLGGFYPYT
ncbi:hypothetical protein B0H13DRAFT_2276760 [Mycena leptocephala]|nr:hypothetical protein B0H13DRAFT_2276760 [Mycena leptocephala]